MFSRQITTSDAFMDMPVSSQLLYFHLNMEADDDGFVGNPKRIIRTVNVGDDDLKVLLAKRFVLAFESGVVVIKHWKMHNAIRRDMYKETQYLDEKKGLLTKENGSYTELRNEAVTKPVHRLDKIRLDQTRLDQVREGGSGGIVGAIAPTPSQTAIDFFESSAKQEDLVEQLVAKGIPDAAARAEIAKFVSYWTEPNSTGKKQRWQLEKTFDVRRRLATWFGNVKQFQGNKTSKTVTI